MSRLLSRLPCLGMGAGLRARLARTPALLLVAAGLLLVLQGCWIPVKAYVAQIMLERAFAQSTGERTVKPWPWFDSYPVARIEAPRLGQSTIALAGASGQALAFGPGHVSGTPQAGEEGTAVYAAHRDTHFTFLRDLKQGDDIVVRRRDGTVVRFQVTGHDVRPWNRSGIDADAPGRNLVLATCWPFDAVTRGPLRYLVFASAQ